MNTLRQTTSARSNLDERDRAIIARLVAEGRTSNRELAQLVGLSPSACLARVRRLEQHGFIVGYRAIVARSGRGARLEGWADIRFNQLTPELIREFSRLVGAAPQIVEAHRIAGRSDYVVRFCGGDMREWNAFRDSLDMLGYQAEARFNLLVEAVK